jgi:hypothetical protein
MAILDRPLFQRRLTKDQLRAYGIPAFANGGIVQRFDNGGDVNRLPFLSDRTNTAIDPDILNKNRNLPPVGTVIRDEIIENEKGEKIRITETVVAGARGMKVVQKKEEVVFSPETTVKTPRGDKVIPATGDEDATVGVDTAISTPVPKEIQDAKNPDQLREALLTAEGPGQDISVKKAAEELEGSGLNNTDSERDRLVELEGLVKERSELYKKILGDPKEGLKQQGLLQLAQFGLNLASARGGNFAEKIAKSAKDPLQAFAALGRESLKDERAIEMLAIKGAEDELARTQKTGTFGQLVQDIMTANPNMSLEEAYAKSIEITSQKAGKSLTEQRNEYADKLVDLYVKEEGLEVEEATKRANQKAMERFPNPTDDAETTTATDETITDLS